MVYNARWVSYKALDTVEYFFLGGDDEHSYRNTCAAPPGSHLPFEWAVLACNGYFPTDTRYTRPFEVGVTAVKAVLAEASILVCASGPTNQAG